MIMAARITGGAFVAGLFSTIFSATAGVSVSDSISINHTCPRLEIQTFICNCTTRLKAFGKGADFYRPVPAPRDDYPARRRATILSGTPLGKFMETLAEQLARQTREAALYKPLDRSRVECFACGHRCPIPSGFAGVCKVRFNSGGKLYAPHGYVNAAFSDPIEKKPFFHALPGARAFSFGMLGCDLHCGYCQNWVSSQALRDPHSTLDFTSATPEELAALAL